MSESEDNNNDSEINNELISRSETNLINIRYELARLYQRHIEECEDLIVPETNKNPNFMLEKDMKYNLYPFYINWKKIEERKNSFYDTFIHYGYFGAAVFSSFKVIDCPINLTYKNIIYTFSSLLYEFLVNSKDKEKDTKEAQLFMEKLPELEMIYKLIKKKIVMFKEIPIYIIVMKIYEIYFLYNVEEKQLIELLKYEYLLISYLKDSEYKEMFQKNFSEKVRKIYEKMVDTIGKQFELPNTKKKLINHIKYIYQNLSKKSKDEALKI